MKIDTRAFRDEIIDRNLTDYQVGWYVQALMIAAEEGGTVDLNDARLALPVLPEAIQRRYDELREALFFPLTSGRWRPSSPWARAAVASDVPRPSPPPEAPPVVVPTPIAITPANRAVPSHFPDNLVGQILVAARVQPNDLTPLYWMRREHLTEAVALCNDLGVSSDVLCRLVRDLPEQPHLRRIQELGPLLRKHGMRGMAR